MKTIECQVCHKQEIPLNNAHKIDNTSITSFLNRWNIIYQHLGNIETNNDKQS